MGYQMSRPVRQYQQRQRQLASHDRWERRQERKQGARDYTGEVIGGFIDAPIVTRPGAEERRRAAEQYLAPSHRIDRGDATRGRSSSDLPVRIRAGDDGSRAGTSHGSPGQFTRHGSRRDRDAGAASPSAGGPSASTSLLTRKAKSTPAMRRGSSSRTRGVAKDEHARRTAARGAEEAAMAEVQSKVEALQRATGNRPELQAVYAAHAHAIAKARGLSVAVDGAGALVGGALTPPPGRVGLGGSVRGDSNLPPLSPVASSLSDRFGSDRGGDGARQAASLGGSSFGVPGLGPGASGSSPIVLSSRPGSRQATRRDRAWADAASATSGGSGSGSGGSGATGMVPSRSPLKPRSHRRRGRRDDKALPSPDKDRDHHGAHRRDTRDGAAAASDAAMWVAASRASPVRAGSFRSGFGSGGGGVTAGGGFLPDMDSLAFLDDEDGATLLSPTVPVDLARPTPPRLLHAASTSITFGWNNGAHAGNATVFEVQWRPHRTPRGVVPPPPAEWVTVTSRIRSREHTLEGLAPGQWVVARVRAWVSVSAEAMSFLMSLTESGQVSRVADGEWSDFSEVSDPMRTRQLAPSKPRAPRADSRQTSSSTLKLHWDPPYTNGSPITLYTLLCGQVNARTGQVDDMTVLYSGPARECDALNLQPATRYSFVVIASNKFGDSDASDAGVASTSAPTSVAPLRVIGEWQEWFDEASRNNYYVHATSGEWRWDLPHDMNRMLRRFGEWTEYWDETSQHCFYYNSRTQERRWDPPDALDDASILAGYYTAASTAGGSGGGSGGGGGAAVRAGGAPSPAATSFAAAGAEASSSSGAAAGAHTGPGTRTGPMPRPRPGGARPAHGPASSSAAASSSPSATEHATHTPVSTQAPDSAFKITDTGALTKDDIEFRKKRYRLLWAARVADVRPGNLAVTIRRAHVVQDSLAAVRRFSRTELQQRLVVSFHQEEGIDSGGLYKEWCLLFSRQALSAKVGLFKRSRAGFYDIDPRALQRPGCVEAYRTLGRFVGKAVFDRQLVDMPLCRSLCIRVLGSNAEPSLDDLEETDPELVSGLRWVLGNDVEGVIEATFSAVRPTVPASVGFGKGVGGAARRGVIETDFFGDPVSSYGEDAGGAGGGGGAAAPVVTTRRGSVVHARRRLSVGGGGGGGGGASRGGETVDLVPSGRDIAVTNDNKAQYVMLMAEWRGYGQAAEAIDAFASGVHELLPRESLREFTVDQLRALFNGRRDVDLAAMRKSVHYVEPLTDSSELVQWFWQAMASFTRQQRGQVLSFATGTSMVPLDGFEPAFTLMPMQGGLADATSGADANLPRSHTCFNQLVLPPHASYAQLREKLLFAIANTEGFTLA